MVSITDSTDVNLSKLGRRWKTEEPGVPQSVGWQKVGRDLVTEQQQKMNCCLAC